MTDETDGVAETFDDTLRVALTVASQFGERFARLREEWQRDREVQARDEAQQLGARLDAERAAAAAQLAAVGRPEWWEHARSKDIAAVHEAATAWRGLDGRAASAARTIRNEVLQRHGIDINRAGADPAAVAVALDRATADRAAAAEQRRRAGDDQTAIEMLVTAADARDKLAAPQLEQARAQAEPDAIPTTAATAHSSAFDYDDPQRRQDLARTLEGTGTAAEIENRIRADLGNAKHPRDAVATRPASAAPRNLTRNRGADRTRIDRSR